MTEHVDDQLIAAAQAALERYIQRRSKQGATIAISRPLYHEGMSTPRCVLSIDGTDVRLYYRKASARWEKS